MDTLEREEENIIIDLDNDAVEGDDSWRFYPPETVVTSIEGFSGAVTLKQLGLDKVQNSESVTRFKQSSVSSAFSGSNTSLFKSDLAENQKEPLVGNLAIFPDDHSRVLYLGTISEVEEDTYTVSDIEYLKDTWIMSGEWVAGPAGYPEVYTKDGSSYLCLVSDTTNAPSDELVKEWACIAKKPSFNDLPDKPEIPHPTYYKMNGDVLNDTGNEQEYIVSVTNLTPATPVPVIGDVVVFPTSNSTYIGTVTQKQNESALIVTAKIALGNGVAAE